jgi:glutaconate CoA-transferase subunit A
MAFPALRPDVAVIHALRADRMGNAQIGRHLGIDPELSLAARTVIVTAEEIVERLDQVEIVGPLVTGVALAPRGAWPTSCHPLYAVDGAALLDYLDACGREAFDEYLAQRLAAQEAA